jgi:hypothetical protein
MLAATYPLDDPPHRKKFIHGVAQDVVPEDLQATPSPRTACPQGFNRVLDCEIALAKRADP